MENTGCGAGRWRESPGLGVMFMAGLPPIRLAHSTRLRASANSRQAFRGNDRGASSAAFKKCGTKPIVGSRK